MMLLHQSPSYITPVPGGVGPNDHYHADRRSLSGALERWIGKLISTTIINNFKSKF